jgi:bacillopeptidase F (M6 metalloprotease family)
MTFYEIEEDWDYGCVEVHDLDTGEWYTLDAAGTVNYVAHGQDNPNTPIEREPTTYETASRWHGFTGYSGGWIPVSMDLTPFAGHNIELYFTTWQDGVFTLQMSMSMTSQSQSLTSPTMSRQARMAGRDPGGLSRMVSWTTAGV